MGGAVSVEYTLLAQKTITSLQHNQSVNIYDSTISEPYDFLKCRFSGQISIAQNQTGGAFNFSLDNMQVMSIYWDAGAVNSKLEGFDYNFYSFLRLKDYRYDRNGGLKNKRSEFYCVGYNSPVNFSSYSAMLQNTSISNTVINIAVYGGKFK